jgi:hypothetical protein
VRSERRIPEFGDSALSGLAVDTFAGPVLEQYSPQEIECGRLDAARQALTSVGYVTNIEPVRRHDRARGRATPAGEVGSFEWTQA